MDSDDVWRRIGRRLAGESSPADAAALEAWAAEPGNAELLEEAAGVWTAAADRSGGPDVDAAWRAVRARLDVRRTVPARPRKRRVAWLAGGLLAAAVAGVLLLPSAPAQAPPEQYATAPAELETIRLGDGTVVRLGPDSRLAVRAARAVELSGVAFFAVAEDRARPFAIAVPGGEVVVLGTRFEVHTAGDSTRVSVVEGRVAVRGASTVVELEAGESTAIVRGAEPRPPAPAAPVVAAWMGRTLVFQNTPIARAAEEIAAVYRVPVEVGPSLDDRTVTALFTDEPLERLITTLCRAVQAQCEVTDSLIRLEAQS